MISKQCTPKAEARARRFRSTCIFPSAKASASSAPATSSSKKIKASRMPYLDVAQTRNRARRPHRFPRTPRRAIPLGRRHAHLSHARANGGSLRFHARALHLRAGRRNRHRNRSARHHAQLISKPCARLGFNRLSMGIQDFHPEVQQTIHRVQPLEMTRDLIARRARTRLRQHQRGPDLRPALPTAGAFRAHRRPDSRRSQPDRIAMFSYAHVPWLKKQQGAFATHLPEGMEKFRYFPRRPAESFSTPATSISAWTISRKPGRRTGRLAAQSHPASQFSGLHHQGRRRPLRHGRQRHQRASANAYAQNHRDIPAYQKAVAERGIATMRGYRLSQDDVIRRAVISRLLCHTVISKRRNRARVRHFI